MLEILGALGCGCQRSRFFEGLGSLVSPRLPYHLGSYEIDSMNVLDVVMTLFAAIDDEVCYDESWINGGIAKW